MYIWYLLRFAEPKVARYGGLVAMPIFRTEDERQGEGIVEYCLGTCVRCRFGVATDRLFSNEDAGTRHKSVLPGPLHRPGAGSRERVTPVLPTNVPQCATGVWSSRQTHDRRTLFGSACENHPISGKSGQFMRCKVRRPGARFGSELSTGTVADRRDTIRGPLYPNAPVRGTRRCCCL